MNATEIHSVLTSHLISKEWGPFLYSCVAMYAYMYQG